MLKATQWALFSALLWTVMFAFVSKSPRAFDFDIKFGGGKLCEGVHACVTDSLSLKQVRAAVM